MDIGQIDYFFDYTPNVDENPQEIVDQIMTLWWVYLSDEECGLIQKAYEFARTAHAWQKRLSGESFISHPVLATLYLMEIKPDIETIQTCLLHDVIEDTDITKEEILEKFWVEVAKLCVWLEKVSKVRYQGEDRQLETLKNTFLAMAQDLRVIFVKLVDRIHNIQTLHFHPTPEKRIRIAQETMKIYVPISKKLWLYRYQILLENGSFKVLEPDQFERVMVFLKKHYANAEKYITRWGRMLTRLLEQDGLHDLSVKWRLKSPYRIYEKMNTKYETTDVTKVMDMLAFRIITNTIPECYSALWIIHAHYRPMINKIKDYIAIPKFNNYQSIHTTVFGMFRFPTEIQIRTNEMDQIAEFWVAAHVAYADDQNYSSKLSMQQSDWIKKMHDTVSQYKSIDNKASFKENLNIELLNKNIFVYTPKGEIIELPEGSSVLDFAFRIHSDVALRFKHALINGVIKPIGHKPQTGDVIAIHTHKGKYTANKDRWEYLHSPTSRAKLMRYIKKLSRQEYVSAAINMINEKLKELTLPLLYADKDKISKTLSDKELYEQLMRILDKQKSPLWFIKEYYPEEVQKQKIPHSSQEKQLPGEYVEIKRNKKVLVTNQWNITYQFCQECLPETDHKIIAKSGKDAMKIHTVECRALYTASFDKLLEAHRQGEKENAYTIRMTLQMPNKPGNLVIIMSTFADLHIAINSISIESSQDELFTVAIESLHNNPTKISFLLNDLKKHYDFVTILKREII